MKHAYSPILNAVNSKIAHAIIQHAQTLHSNKTDPVRVHIVGVGDDIRNLVRHICKAWIGFQESVIAFEADMEAYVNSQFTDCNDRADVIVVLCKKTFSGVSMSQRFPEIDAWFSDDDKKIITAMSLFGNSNDVVTSVYGGDDTTVAFNPGL